MKNKMKNKKGFTLMEMLIVVAIMVVLVAVAVPTFTSQVSKAKRTADEANIRAAKSIAATTYLVDGVSDETNGDTYWFDAANGKLIKSTESKPGKYGQGVSDTSEGDSSNSILQVTIKPDGEIELSWVTAS